jgi:hypothetical protein
MGQCRFKSGVSTPLLQRRIGLCGDATRAPTGACKQQKGRTVFNTKAAPASSFCWSRKKAKNPPHPYHGMSKTKSINQSDQTTIYYQDRSHISTSIYGHFELFVESGPKITLVEGLVLCFRSGLATMARTAAGRYFVRDRVVEGMAQGWSEAVMAGQRHWAGLLDSGGARRPNLPAGQ